MPKQVSVGLVGLRFGGEFPPIYRDHPDVSTVSLCDKDAPLPEPIRRYTRAHTILDPQNPHLSIQQGGGHHGSHPHMIHEFVRSIVEGRKAVVDEVTAARWSAVGVCAHASALRDGEPVDVPSFE